jgi:ADP-ribose pyrophosphatase
MTPGDADAGTSIAPGQVSRRRSYTGRIIAVDTDTVRFPDGSTGELDMIRHPGASAIVPFLSAPDARDPQLLLIKQYRYAAGQYLYEIPAGRLEPNEDPRDCASRELREETGCTAQQLDFLTTIYTTPGFTDERIHLFMATRLDEGDPSHETDEFMTTETMTLSNALRLIEDGTIIDGKTVIGILFAAGYRAKR